MEKFGTDALRFALAQAAAPGRDMQVSDESFLAARILQIKYGMLQDL